MPLEDYLQHLTFEESGSWRLCPTWTEYFHNIGRWVARETKVDRRAIIAIATPAKAYAPVFVALGVVTESLTAGQIIKDEEYFNDLLNVPIGTGVQFTKNGTENIGVIDGKLTAGGEDWLKIRVENADNSARWACVSSRDANSIRLAHVSLSNLPARQAGRQLTLGNEFSRYILPELDSACSVTMDDIDCILVGRQSVFRDQILNTRFRIKDGLQQYVGCLQDLIRAEGFPLSRRKPRTVICKLNGQIPPSRAMTAKAVIFDGSNSFLKHHNDLSTCPWIIVLDRCEPSFMEGVEVVNQRFVTNRVDVNFEGDFPCAPPGVETTVFWEGL